MTTQYPLLPLRDIVVFPQMIVPLFVGRDKSVAALESAMEGDKEIFLVSQLDPAEDDPGQDSLYDTGVIAVVLQLLKLPDGTVRVLVEGKQRARLDGMSQAGGHLIADVTAVEEIAAEGPEAAALMRSVAEQFENYAKLNKKLPAETPVQLREIEDAGRLADAVAANINVKVADKQLLLVEPDQRPGDRRRAEHAFAVIPSADRELIGQRLALRRVHRLKRLTARRSLPKTVDQDRYQFRCGCHGLCPL